MKEKIIGIILVIGLGVYLVNMTSWGEIKYRQAKDSILHSKECKIVDKSTQTNYFSAKDYDCKYDKPAYYDNDVTIAIIAKLKQESQCRDEFNNGEKVLLKANTNCNTDTFFYSVVTENGEIVSRELVMTNDGKIKEFVNLGRGIDIYGVYDVHFFHTR